MSELLVCLRSLFSFKKGPIVHGNSHIHTHCIQVTSPSCYFSAIFLLLSLLSSVLIAHMSCQVCFYCLIFLSWEKYFAWELSFRYLVFAKMHESYFRIFFPWPVRVDVFHFVVIFSFPRSQTWQKRNIKFMSDEELKKKENFILSFQFLYDMKTLLPQLISKLISSWG